MIKIEGGREDDRRSVSPRFRGRFYPWKCILVDCSVHLLAAVHSLRGSQPFAGFLHRFLSIGEDFKGLGRKARGSFQGIDHLPARFPAKEFFPWFIQSGRKRFRCRFLPRGSKAFHKPSDPQPEKFIGSVLTLVRQAEAEDNCINAEDLPE